MTFIGGVVTQAGNILYQTQNQLASSASPGATQITLGADPLDLVKVGALIAIEAGNANCELRIVTNISSRTLTLNSALELSHSASVPVLLLLDSVVHPLMFGCKGDNVTDDWQGLQRMLYQANELIANTQYGPTLDGGGLTYRIQQPLTFSQHTMRNIKFNAYTTFAPADANNAMMMSCTMAHFPVTATAADDKFQCLSPNVFPNVGQTIVFNNMYGETLPGNVVAGRVYFVTFKAADQRSITVSATKGGATLDITSDGAGWAAGQIAELTKFWWKDVIINVNFADLSGLAFGSQQPADIYRLRVNMVNACSRTTYGVSINQAQIARLYNPEFVVNGATNVIALGIGPAHIYPTGDVQVSGVHVQDANFDGATDSGQTHIAIGGGLVCDNIVLSGDTWLEGPGDAGVKLLSPARGVDLGRLFLSGNPTNGAVHESADGIGWKLGQIFNSGSNHINVKTFQGTLFKSYGSSDSIFADVANTTAGMVRIASSATPALQLIGRLYSSTTSSITVDWIVETLDVDATGGIRTATLPTAVGVATVCFTIRKKDSSGNAVTVATTSSQTINGASTYSLASQYKYVTVQSDGANWMVVANN